MTTKTGKSEATKSMVPCPAAGGPQQVVHPCCRNCVYAARASGRWFRVLMSRSPGLLICANSADAPGELQGVAPAGFCPNFRPRRPSLVRAAPPDGAIGRMRLMRLMAAAGGIAFTGPEGMWPRPLPPQATIGRFSCGFR